MSFYKLAREFSSPVATIFAGGLLFRMGTAILEKFDQAEERLGKKIDLVEVGLGKEIDQVGVGLKKEIEKAQFIAANAALVTIEDPNKFGVAKQKLQRFSACVKGGGSKDCIQDKEMD